MPDDTDGVTISASEDRLERAREQHEYQMATTRQSGVVNQKKRAQCVLGYISGEVRYYGRGFLAMPLVSML